MREVGQYCKAYSVSFLSKYTHWNENFIGNTVKRQKIVNGEVIEEEHILTDNDVVYLQENYTVTDGIFLNENIIFDRINEEWQEYCKSVLNFKVPSMEKSSMTEPQVSEAKPSETKKTRKPKRQKGEPK